jgi:nicotinate-nucleotide adenylyltransferase
VTDVSPQPTTASNPGRRIGLFGGTFDPPHRAHLELARVARDALALDELRWIPAGQPWQKDRAITPARHREAMVRLAIEGEPRFVLERCELERAGPSFMIDTVKELQARAPGAHWVLLLGQDQLAGLHTWRDWQALLQRVELAVAQRPGVQAPVHEAVQGIVRQAVPLPLLDIASTDIRQRVLRGEPIDHLVPPAVARYIALHLLYRKDAATAH